ncbi:hypothetical protein BJV82DRAFT_671063 [Fennellomyces sp. T-0311]|nr:hypothetical protein BJV82DRAFT_671063 [Fennellomyces sp. T-0311]
MSSNQESLHAMSTECGNQPIGPIHCHAANASTQHHGRNQQWLQALEEAHGLMACAPNSSKGFLRAASLYTSLGYQAQAIDVLEKGISLVSDDCSQLIELRDNAKTKQERRMDIITQVPYDILCKIASYLPANALGECVLVSHHWQSTIAECPAFWRDVHLEGPKAPLHLLPRASGHIRTMKLSIDERLATRVYSVMANNGFSNLQSMSIDWDLPEQRELAPKARSRGFDLLSLVGARRNRRQSVPAPLPNYSRVCEFLPYVAKTLTEIKLHLPQYESGPSLAKILYICRNLRTVEYTCPSATAFAGLLALRHTTLLTSIYLHPKGSVMSQIDFLKLLQWSPNVRSLILKECNFNVLNTIQRLGLKIDFLSVCRENFRYLPDPAKYVNDKQDAFRYLALMDGWTRVPLLLSFLQENRDSIERLHLLWNWNDFSIHNLQTVTIPNDFPSMNNLKSLYIANVTLDGFWTSVPSILQKCPNLDTFIIEDRIYDLEIEPVVMDAVVQATTFRCLKLVDGDLDSPALSRLLATYGTVDAGLNELELDYCRSSTGIMHAAGIRSLKKVSIRGGESMRPVLHKFAQALATLPHLEYVYMAGKHEYVDNETINALCESSSLKTIHLDGAYDATVESSSLLCNRSLPIELKLTNGKGGC